MGKQVQVTKSSTKAIVANERLHWTEKSVDDFIHRIAFDFVTQVDDELAAAGVSHADLAERLNVTKGRVSQIINSPANISLRNVVKYARAAGRKVALVLYDDGDPQNFNGPISPSIFSRCWEMVGRPTDFFQLADASFWRVSVSITFNYCHLQGTAYGTMTPASGWTMLDTPNAFFVSGACVLASASTEIVVNG